MANKRLIIYQEAKSGKELCRDNEVNFIPDFGDTVILDDFKLTNTTNSFETSNKKWNVQEREIHESHMIVYLS